MTTRSVGALLIQAGATTEERVAEALARQSTDARRLGALLLDAGAVSAGALRTALGAQSGVRFVDLVEVGCDPEVGALLPGHFAEGLGVIPLRRDGDTLIVATRDPGATVLLDELTDVLGAAQLGIVGVTAADWDAFQRYDAASTELAVVVRRQVERLLSDLDPTVTDSLILERTGRLSRLRERRHGRLHTRAAVPARLHAALAAALEDASRDSGGQIIARTFGSPEQRTLTLTPARVAPRSAPELGLATEDLQHLDRLMQRGAGLVLVIGPHASGRTTTAAALVTPLAASRHIVALTTGRQPTGLGAPLTATSPALLHDAVDGALGLAPDVILVDVARVEDLPRLASAAHDGRLVVATLSGTRVVETLRLALTADRLTRWRIAAAFSAAIAQRLVRAPCPDCACDDPESAAFMTEFGVPAEVAARVSLRRAQGCTSCHGSGVAGRVLLSEVLVATDELRAALRDDATPARLLELARQSGAHTLWEDGVAKALAGQTTAAELRRVLTEPSP